MKKYTLITGACGGLGREFVKLCLFNKENLLLLGTSEQKLDLLKKDLSDLFGDFYKDIDIKTCKCDISKKEDRLSLIEFIKTNEISVNRLINNAGLIIEGDLLRFEDDEIIKAVEINCIGTLDLTQKIIKIRDENQKLEVLTVSSLAGKYPIPHMAVYAATKSFLISMMTALSVEFKDKNIVFSTVCPSGIATTKEMKESIESMGFGAKITTLSAEKIAKISLKGLKKRKAIIVPGAINKAISVISKLFSTRFLAKVTGKMWKKSQQKRKF